MEECPLSHQGDILWKGGKGDSRFRRQSPEVRVPDRNLLVRRMIGCYGRARSLGPWIRRSAWGGRGVGIDDPIR